MQSQVQHLPWWFTTPYNAYIGMSKFVLKCQGAFHLTDLAFQVFGTPILMEDTLEFKSEEPTDIHDGRGDLVSLNKLKHEQSMVVKGELTKRFLLPTFDSIEGIQPRKIVRPTFVSLEMLSQVLTQPVAKFSTDEKTTWQKINMSLGSLHTINEDRYSSLDLKMIRQETALAAQFIFNVRRQELDDFIPFRDAP